ncbi:MAG: membrane protein insertase YidC [Chloroflexi bacterium]|nr:membrane protein insertase YidC [Chloroflexota bacterium]
MWDTLIINPFTNVLVLIYDAIGHNFGIAIILFTILIRLVTWPLNGQQLKATKVMQDLQNDKEWQDIQKKYAKDREKLAQEQMRIYKERGINPLASCLPMLIQFPVIIGLYQSIIRALATNPLGLLQLARSLYPFLNSALLIPLNSKFLWMDLGRPEGIPFPGGFTLSFLPYGFPTLAIIVAVTTYLQTKLTMPPPSTNNPNDQAAAMNSMMSLYMPLFLGWLVLNYASGLAVYFVTSNVLGIVQYAMMGRVNWRNLLPGGSKPAPSKNK